MSYKIGSNIVLTRVYTPDTSTEDSILGLLELKGWIPKAIRPRGSGMTSGLSVFYLKPKEFGPFARDLVGVAVPFGLEVREDEGDYTLTEMEPGGRIDG